MADSLPDINNEADLTAAAENATTPEQQEHAKKHAHRLGLSHKLAHLLPHWGKSKSTTSTR